MLVRNINLITRTVDMGLRSCAIAINNGWYLAGFEQTLTFVSSRASIKRV